MSLRKLFFLLIILCVVIVIGMFLMLLYFRSDRHFIGQIQKKASTPKDLYDNHSELLSRANSAPQYLMLLKRLDAYDMNAVFQKALETALQEYTTIELQALALNQQIYTNNFSLFSSFTFNVAEIYQQYPALVRYYLYVRYKKAYVLTHADEDDPFFFLSHIAIGDSNVNLLEKNHFIHYDELLQFLYFSQEYTRTIYDYYLLYNLTKRDIFQFILYLYYSIKNDSTMSSVLLANIDDTWKMEHKDLIEKSTLLLSYPMNRNISSLTGISHDSFYAIALDLYAKDINSALLYLQRLVDTYSIHELDDAALELYFWLSRNFSKEYDIKKLGDYFLQIKHRIYNSVPLTLQYMLYLYTVDPEKGMQVLNTFHFSASVLESPYIQYLKILLEGYDIPYQDVFLQQKLESFFSIDDRYLFYDLLLLRAGKIVQYYDSSAVSVFFSQYIEFENILFPYKMYYLLQRASLKDLAQDEKENMIMLFHLEDTSWWNAFNVAIWNTENKNFSTALQYLQISQDTVPYLTNYLQIQYLIQYIRIAIFQKNYDLAEVYIDSLQKLQATNSYIQLLQNMLEQSKNTPDE